MRLLSATTAAALSTALVFGHATNNTADSLQVQLAAVTIGIGGRDDPDAVNIPTKLNGNVRPNGFTYIPVHYPAGLDIDNSVAAGVPVLDQAVKDNSDQFLMVVGYSEGALVAEKVRRGLDPSDPDAPPTDGLRFVMIASAHIPNGGIFARFPGFGIPFFVTSTGPAQPSPYDTMYVTNEYDTYADFPAYFNPLSLANALVAVVYVHSSPNYDSVDYDPLTGTGTTPVLAKTVTNSAGGTDNYVFVPASHLPLLAPVRQLAGMVGLAPFTEPLLGSVEPLIRLVVDMGYTDRENLNPEVPVRFSPITPPGKVLEAIVGVPGALVQGLTNFVTGLESIPGSIPAPIAPTTAPTDSLSVSAKSQPQKLQEVVVVVVVNTDTAPAQAKEPAPTDATATVSTDATDPAADATDPASPQTPSGSSTSTRQPPVFKVTEDGKKATPNTPTRTASPKKNVLTQLNDTVKGFLSGGKKKKPTSSAPSSASSTPSSERNDSTSSDSTSGAQSEGSTSKPAA